MTQNRDREVNFQKKIREFSRIETLAGYCREAHLGFKHLCEAVIKPQKSLTSFISQKAE